mmetsp:Transcript_5810/g.12456  ORF Transcript_5810/g.12456 Transcript_5810/m.12456 type:complete len:253 (+) Transcript_5810:928-1686(+)
MGQCHEQRALAATSSAADTNLDSARAREGHSLKNHRQILPIPHLHSSEGDRPGTGKALWWLGGTPGRLRLQGVVREQPLKARHERFDHGRHSYHVLEETRQQDGLQDSQANQLRCDKVPHQSSSECCKHHDDHALHVQPEADESIGNQPPEPCSGIGVQLADHSQLRSFLPAEGPNAFQPTQRRSERIEHRALAEVVQTLQFSDGLHAESPQADHVPEDGQESGNHRRHSSADQYSASQCNATQIQDLMHGL